MITRVFAKPRFLCITILSMFLSAGFTLSFGQDTTSTSVKADLFQSNEEIKSVEELEDYIRTNKKLPDFLSEKEIEEKGFNRDEMTRRLVKVVKKLHVYVIELKKENKKLKNRIKKIEAYLQANQE